MAIDPGGGPRSRVEWAERHLLALGAAYRSFVEGHPFHIAMERDTLTGDHIGRLHIDPPLPHELSMIIGDFVHSLRAALDNMIWLLREPDVADERLLRHVVFKIVEAATVDEAEQEWSTFHTIAQACVPATVLERMHQFQPHVTGRTELATLNQLGTVDRQRAPFIAVNQVSRFGVLLISDEGPPLSDVTFSDGPFAEGDVIVRIRDTEEAQPRLDPYFAMYPVLDEEGSVRGQSLFDLLPGLQDYIADEVIPAFERL